MAAVTVPGLSTSSALATTSVSWTSLSSAVASWVGTSRWSARLSISSSFSSLSMYRILFRRAYFASRSRLSRSDTVSIATHASSIIPSVLSLSNPSR